MSRIFKILLLTLLLCLLASWLVFGEHGLIYVHKRDKERQAYLEKIEELGKENQKLMKEIDMLKNDKEYIEKTIVNQLGMIRDGHVLYRFAEDKEDKNTPEQAIETQN